MSRFFRRSTFITLASVTLLFSQSDTGSLSGHLSDPSGASVAGATVALTSDTTGISFPTTTNQSGFYEYASVPVGSYTIEIGQKGFKTHSPKRHHNRHCYTSDIGSGIRPGRFKANRRSNLSSTADR